MDSLPVLTEIMTKPEATRLNPLVLAYVGDAVHTLYVRTKLVEHSDAKTGALHKLATSEVKAVHQSVLAGILLPVLTEEETAVFKRARNSKLNSTAKHAELSEYRRATGFEAVLGYLYLVGEMERLTQILELCATPVEKPSEGND